MNLPEQDDPEFERWMEENPGLCRLIVTGIIGFALVVPCAAIYFVYKFWYP